MLSRLILIFVTVPLVELALLLQVGQWIGAGPTVALVVVTGLAGAALARQQGLRAYMAVQRELAAGRLPGGALLDGVSILAGGALLLTPGILTDALGFGLIVPRSRRWIQARFRRVVERRVREGAVQFRVFGGDVFPGDGFAAQGRAAGPETGRGNEPRRGSETGRSDETGRDETGRGSQPRQELGTHPPKPGARR